MGAVAALAAGWRAPTGGRVLLGGMDAALVAAAGHPRGLLATVPQTPQLFSGTLRHNIACAAARSVFGCVFVFVCLL